MRITDESRASQGFSREGGPTVIFLFLKIITTFIIKLTQLIPLIAFLSHSVIDPRIQLLEKF